MTYKYRRPGPRLQHREEYRDLDAQELLDRIFYWALIVTAIFVFAAVWITR